MSLRAGQPDPRDRPQYPVPGRAPLVTRIATALQARPLEAAGLLAGSSRRLVRWSGASAPAPCRRSPARGAGANSGHDSRPSFPRSLRPRRGGPADRWARLRHRRAAAGAHADLRPEGTWHSSPEVRWHHRRNPIASGTSRGAWWRSSTMAISCVGVGQSGETDALVALARDAAARSPTRASTSARLHRDQRDRAAAMATSAWKARALVHRRAMGSADTPTRARASRGSTAPRCRTLRSRAAGAAASRHRRRRQHTTLGARL